LVAVETGGLGITIGMDGIIGLTAPMVVVVVVVVVVTVFET